METPLFVVIPPCVLIMLVPEVMKRKLNLQIIEIVDGMGKELDRRHVGGEMYQATYILYQVKGVYHGMIHAFNDIVARPPE